MRASLEPADPLCAKTLPAELYIESNILDAEYCAIFEHHWQLVGHINQLNKPGDQITCQVGRIPIVVVLNQDKELRAFHNVCRHRAGPVASGNSNSKVLRCQYHGWTYTLDGALRSAPEMSTTPDFKTCQYHLPKAKVEEWQGFVFVSVNLSPPPLNEVLNEISETIKPIDLSTLSYSHSDEYLLNCNWKVYMDNYLEGYHLPHVHPGLNKLLDYRSYDTLLHPWYSYQFSPLENTPDSNNFYGEGSAHYYCIYPNLMLNILPGRLQINRIYPVSNNKTKVIFEYYYLQVEEQSTNPLIKQDQAFSDEIQEEDIDICEKVQQGLNSGSYDTGRLCMKREMGVMHFHDLIRQSLRQAIENKLIELD